MNKIIEKLSEILANQGKELLKEVVKGCLDVASEIIKEKIK